MASFKISGKKRAKVEKYVKQELKKNVSAKPIRKNKKIKSWQVMVEWYTTPPARKNICIKEV